MSQGNKFRHWRKQIMKYFLSLALIFSGSHAFANEGIPHNWIKAGSFPSGYAVSIKSSGMYQNQRGVVLRSTETLPSFVGTESSRKYKNRLDIARKSKKIGSQPFVTLMQTILADKYRGHRVLFSGYLRVRNTAGKASLWMRVDGPDGRVMGFDNLMKKQALSGNSSWQKKTVVMDIPSEAATINLGILLSGAGTVETSDLKFKIVEKNVPVTAKTENDYYPRSPMNLNFK